MIIFCLMQKINSNLLRNHRFKINIMMDRNITEIEKDKLYNLYEFMNSDEESNYYSTKYDFVHFDYDYKFPSIDSFEEGKELCAYLDSHNIKWK